jgi:hypothetical protein
MSTRPLIPLASITSDDLSSFPDPDSRSTVGFVPYHRVTKPPDPDRDVARGVLELSTQVASLTSFVGLQNSMHSERIACLESEIHLARHTITDLRMRIGRLTSLAIPSDESKTSACRATAAELTQDTAVDFLETTPMLLTNFVDGAPPDGLIDLLQRLDRPTQSVFLRYSMSQLDRFIRCLQCFRELSNMIESTEFSETLTGAVSKIFTSDRAFLFLRDPKTSNYITRFDTQSIHISLKHGDSVIASVVKSGKPSIFTDPTKAAHYSLSLDPLLNPDNLPILVIPFGIDAVVLALHTDKTSFTFTNEDQAIGSLLMMLLQPLLRGHIKHMENEREQQMRKGLQSFEIGLLGCDSFKNLLPFLKTSVRKLIGVTDLRIYLRKDGLLVSYDMVDERLLETKYDMGGIPAWVLKMNFHLMVEALNGTEIPSYNCEIDGWAEGRPFAAFPVFETKDNAVAVFCIVGERPFVDWDFEFLTSVCADLSLLIPGCLANASAVSADEAGSVLEAYPRDITGFRFESFTDRKQVEILAKLLKDYTKAEYISVHSRSERLIAMHNDEFVDEEFVSQQFVDYVFECETPVNETDPARVPYFESQLRITSLMSACNADKRIAFLGLNSLSSTGQFDVSYHSIVSSCLNFIIITQKIQDQTRAIELGKSAMSVMENAFQLCTISLQAKDPMMDFLTSITDHLQFKYFALLRSRPLAKGFQVLLVSPNCESGTIHASDPFVQRIITFRESAVIADLPTDSQLLMFFPEVLLALAIPIDLPTQVYAVFLGDTLVSNYFQAAEYFAPLLVLFYRLFAFTSEPPTPTPETSDRLKPLDSDITSRLFSVTLFDEVQKAEIAARILSNGGFCDVAQTTPERLAVFVKHIRSLYRTIPYHNWTHAIDCAQFAFACVYRGNLMRALKPVHLSALFAAVLCHDVGHRGFSTPFHVGAKTALFSAYGAESTLERHHLAIATTAIREHFPALRDHVFWKFFSACILATDMVRHFEYMDKFRVLTLGFNPANPKDAHVLLVAELIAKAANIANTTRPFDVAKLMGENLMKEVLEEGRRQHELGVVVGPIAEVLEAHRQTIADVEIEFYVGIAFPLLKHLSSVIPELSDLAVQMEDNRKQWEDYRVRLIAS